MRKLFLLVFVLMCGTLSYAQDDKMKEINTIKSSNKYVYVMGTSLVSEAEAVDNSRLLLEMEIEQWLKEEKITDIQGYVAKSKKNVSQIMTRRGKQFRVFAYVKKKDINPYYKDDQIIVVDFDTPDPSEKPVKPLEKPSQTMAANTNNNTSSTNLTPNKASTTTTSTVTPTKPTVTPSNPPVEKTKPTSKEPQIVTEYKDLLSIKTFLGLNDFVNRGRDDGSIIDIGRYKDLPNSGTVFVFIHNPEGKIAACMKVVDGSATNISTGLPDKITNYKGCGVIWVKFK